MSDGLTVSWHNPGSVAAPAGWTEFITDHQLPVAWDWPIIHAYTAGSNVAVLAATIQDGAVIRALVTARFPGLRAGRQAVPLAGVVDVDCLASSSLPGIATAGLGEADVGELPAEFLVVLREALQHEFGARVRALMFRQVAADWLPAVLRWPAIAREGKPIARFQNRFTTFDDYLAALSRSRRWSLRKLIRDIEADPQVAISFTARGDPPVPLDFEAARALQGRVVDRHHQQWWLRKRLLPRLLTEAQLAHASVHRTTYHRPGGELIGFSLSWDHPVVPEVGVWGAPAPAEGGRDGLWFHCMALHIRWCIESGRAAIRIGQGSAAEKRRLGCELRRQWAVLVPLRRRGRG